MAGSNYRTTPEQIETMPPGIKYIVGNEAAERFSFYGMKAFLAVFMTKYLLDSAGQPDVMDEETAKVWVHNFVTAAYFFPIFGALISDWLLGKYLTIMSLSMVYCAGHFVLALIDTPLAAEVAPRTLLWWGLALIGVGAGGIKPCVSAHVGDQFGKKNEDLLPRVFRWFYFSINLGAALSTLATPLLLNDPRFGPTWAFGVPGVLMALATFVFWLGRHKFVHVPPGGKKFFEETFSREGLRAITNLIPLYVFIAMFWALFDQTASAWVLQANDMNRSIPLPDWFGQLLFQLGDYDVPPTQFEILSSQVQAANPILILILIPVFSLVVYPAMNRLFTLTPLRKIGIGLFVTVIAFAIPGWIELRIVAGETPHVIWQLVAYVVMTAAEVMVSITTLEFSYTQAPKRMKSFVMGLYLLSVAVGNQFTARVNAYIKTQKSEGVAFLDGANYYWFFAAAMLLTAIIYVVWSQFYRGQKYIQDGAEPIGTDLHNLTKPTPPKV